MPTTTSQPTTLPLQSVDVSYPALDLWRKQCLDAATTTARLQLAWMQSMGDAMQHEAEFFTSCAAINQKLVRSFSEPSVLRSPEQVGECYGEAVKELADAQLQRMRRVADLPDEFRTTLWEEL